MNIPDADQDTCRMEDATSQHNGLTVRCVVTDQYGDRVISDEAGLFVLPQTGDEAPLMLWFLMALTSAAALMLLWRRRYSG